MKYVIVQYCYANVYTQPTYTIMRITVHVNEYSVQQYYWELQRGIEYPILDRAG